MSGELVKRLLDWEMWDEGDINDTREEAAYRIKELEAKLANAMQIIDAFIEDEGYVPKRVEKLYAELVPEEWDGDTWRS
jgi:hypothetical protein